MSSTPKVSLSSRLQSALAGVNGRPPTGYPPGRGGGNGGGNAAASSASSIATAMRGPHANYQQLNPVPADIAALGPEELQAVHAATAAAKKRRTIVMIIIGVLILIFIIIIIVFVVTNAKAKKRKENEEKHLEALAEQARLEDARREASLAQEYKDDAGPTGSSTTAPVPVPVPIPVRTSPQAPVQPSASASATSDLEAALNGLGGGGGGSSASTQPPPCHGSSCPIPGMGGVGANPAPVPYQPVGGVPPPQYAQPQPQPPRQHHQTTLETAMDISARNATTELYNMNEYLNGCIHTVITKIMSALREAKEVLAAQPPPPVAVTLPSPIVTTSPRRAPATPYIAREEQGSDTESGSGSESESGSGSGSDTESDPEPEPARVVPRRSDADLLRAALELNDAVMTSTPATPAPPTESGPGTGRRGRRGPPPPPPHPAATMASVSDTPAIAGAHHAETVTGAAGTAQRRSTRTRRQIVGSTPQTSEDEITRDVFAMPDPVAGGPSR